jgi:hypothetical protein
MAPKIEGSDYVEKRTGGTWRSVALGRSPANGKTFTSMSEYMLIDRAIDNVQGILNSRQREGTFNNNK